MNGLAQCFARMALLEVSSELEDVLLGYMQPHDLTDLLEFYCHEEVMGSMYPSQSF